MGHGVLCQKCGSGMSFNLMIAYRDYKNGNTFVDFLYECDECGFFKAMRMSDLGLHVLHVDKKSNYRVCLENREVIAKASVGGEWCSITSTATNQQTLGRK